MILIVERTSKKQKLIQESLQKIFPGYKNFVVDKGEEPFEVLKHQQNVEMVIICEPTTAYYNKTNPLNAGGAIQADHAVEWIEALRHGCLWNTHASKKLIIKPKTKEQLPILYIHPYNKKPIHAWQNGTNANYYPSSFPEQKLVDMSTLPKAMKFTKKWYKSVGANELVFYPWETEELKQAFLNCINKRFWHRADLGMAGQHYPGEIPK